MAPKVTLWRRLFQKSDLASELAEHVIEDQAKYEAARRAGAPAYTPDQRRAALAQRLVRAVGVGVAVPPEAIDIVGKAALDWEKASKAALEVRS